MAAQPPHSGLFVFFLLFSSATLTDAVVFDWPFTVEKDSLVLNLSIGTPREQPLHSLSTPFLAAQPLRVFVADFGENRASLWVSNASYDLWFAALCFLLISFQGLFFVPVDGHLPRRVRGANRDDGAGGLRRKPPLLPLLSTRCRSERAACGSSGCPSISSVALTWTLEAFFRSHALPTTPLRSCRRCWKKRTKKWSSSRSTSESCVVERVNGCLKCSGRCQQ